MAISWEVASLSCLAFPQQTSNVIIALFPRESRSVLSILLNTAFQIATNSSLALEGERTSGMLDIWESPEIYGVRQNVEVSRSISRSELVSKKK